jgi:hypothetical protein
MRVLEIIYAGVIGHLVALAARNDSCDECARRNDWRRNKASERSYLDRSSMELVLAKRLAALIRTSKSPNDVRGEGEAINNVE